MRTSYTVTNSHNFYDTFAERRCIQNIIFVLISILWSAEVPTKFNWSSFERGVNEWMRAKEKQKKLFVAHELFLFLTRWFFNSGSYSKFKMIFRLRSDSIENYPPGNVIEPKSARIEHDRYVWCSRHYWSDAHHRRHRQPFAASCYERDCSDVMMRMRRIRLDITNWNEGNSELVAATHRRNASVCDAHDMPVRMCCVCASACMLNSMRRGSFSVAEWWTTHDNFYRVYSVGCNACSWRYQLRRLDESKTNRIALTFKRLEWVWGIA